MFLRVTWLMNTPLSPLEGLSASRDVAQTCVSHASPGAPAWPELRGSSGAAGAASGLLQLLHPLCLCPSLCCCPGKVEGLGWFLS